VRNFGIALFRGVARRMHVTEILPSVGIDDDPGLERQRLRAFPEEELLSVALEGDLHDVRHQAKAT
jgi:hypothetical protein